MQHEPQYQLVGDKKGRGKVTHASHISPLYTGHCNA